LLVCAERLCSGCSRFFSRCLCFSEATGDLLKKPWVFYLRCSQICNQRQKKKNLWGNEKDRKKDTKPKNTEIQNKEFSLPGIISPHSESGSNELSNLLCNQLERGEQKCKWEEKEGNTRNNLFHFKQGFPLTIRKRDDEK
jgi:hypothetical protein